MLIFMPFYKCLCKHQCQWYSDGIKFFKVLLETTVLFCSFLSFQDGIQYGCQKQENAITVDTCTSNLPSSKNLHTHPILLYCLIL